MRQLLYIGITIIMIFFKTQAHSNYEKVFYDFSIESIDGQVINLSEYKNLDYSLKDFNISELNLKKGFYVRARYVCRIKKAL